MVRIAPVNLNLNPKTLWFDAGDLTLRAGDGVVVETARGTEFGRLSDEIFEADESQVKKLKSPLKPVRRSATADDEVQADAMARKGVEALPIFRQMVTESGTEMRPVSVEYLFDGDKAVFYFEAEERVDFRELVRKLAGYFRVRIDMRQIGVRDEARMVGGLGHCGQELCCKRLGGEFCPVSIRMAKEQDLSLNSQKISGVCGRLMCCLRYEFDAYKEFKSRAPKQGGQVETPDGAAKVVNLDIMREVVSLKVNNEKPVKVPLADFEPPTEGTRPRVVGGDAWQAALEEDPMGGVGESSIFTTSQFTCHDKLADKAAITRVSGAQKTDTASASCDEKSARKGGSRKSNSQETQPREGSSNTTRRPRRRSTKVCSENTAQVSSGQAENCQVSANGNVKNDQQPQKKQGNPKKRRTRNQYDAAKQQPRKKQGSQAPQKDRQEVESRKHDSQAPRPGHKSSGLRQNQGQKSQENRDSSTDQSKKEGYRRPRRRSHRSVSGEAQGSSPSQNSNK